MHLALSLSRGHLKPASLPISACRCAPSLSRAGFPLATRAVASAMRLTARHCAIPPVRLPFLHSALRSLSKPKLAKRPFVHFHYAQYRLKIQLQSSSRTGEISAGLRVWRAAEEQ